jgi:CRISPR-associated protein Cmr1
MKGGQKTMRKPNHSPPDIQPQPKHNIIRQVREYRLITPLFGGGVEPGVYDPITPIRGTEVRGHLRFWWRACRGGQFGDNLEAMKKEEDAIWGAAASATTGAGPSYVQVVVQVTNEGKDDRPFEVVRKGRTAKPQPRQGSSAPPYAAFPLQPTDEEARQGGVGMETKAVRVGVAFHLTVSFPETYRADIEAALWAWETFGGIGARTRRGFGALRLVKVDGRENNDIPCAEPQQAEQWLQDKIKTFITHQQWSPNVPHLSMDHQRYKVVDKEWHALITALNTFRQQRRDKNTHKKNKYGHSDWTEPNAIRRIFNKTFRGPHANRPIDKFPRAQFGLPIVFHMAHDNGIDTILQGEDKGDDRKDRLASPLILKPLACQDNKALGLALILEGIALPEPLILKDAPEGKNVVEASLTQQEAKQIPPLNGQTDVLQAFLNTL